MITAISAIIGFLSSMFPDLLALFREKADREHEIKILDMQLKQQAAGHNNKLEAIDMEADIAEMQALYKTYKSGIDWVDALNGTVRPILAYAFFIMYFTIKMLQFHSIDFANPLPWQIDMVWGIEDQAIFAAVISFYFGQRAFGKVRNANYS